MASRDAAAILRWDAKLGSLQPGRYADLLVIASTAADPYTQLVEARDCDIAPVAIAGTPRYGSGSLMQALVPDGHLESAGATAPAGRLLNLQDDSTDPLVADLTVADAAARLSAALAGLPNRPTPAPQPTTGKEPTGRQLALDEIRPTGMTLRPRLPLHTARPSRPHPPRPPLPRTT
ncbi:hypothetical protein [Kitasatospora acidiphila]|uniref:hypothetical protein n=1 Tax=Kitasatospora acidiphila TaxID=2567942 RepID=UPI003C72F139